MAIYSDDPRPFNDDSLQFGFQFDNDIERYAGTGGVTTGFDYSFSQGTLNEKIDLGSNTAFVALNSDYSFEDALEPIVTVSFWLGDPGDRNGLVFGGALNSTDDGISSQPVFLEVSEGYEFKIFAWNGAGDATSTTVRLTIGDPNFTPIKGYAFLTFVIRTLVNSFEVDMYKDGVHFSTVVEPGQTRNNTNPLYLGAAPSSMKNTYNSLSVDQFMYFNRALTSTEILELYNMELRPPNNVKLGVLPIDVFRLGTEPVDRIMLGTKEVLAIPSGSITIFFNNAEGPNPETVVEGSSNGLWTFTVPRGVSTLQICMIGAGGHGNGWVPEGPGGSAGQIRSTSMEVIGSEEISIILSSGSNTKLSSFGSITAGVGASENYRGNGAETTNCFGTFYDGLEVGNNLWGGQAGFADGPNGSTSTGYGPSGVDGSGGPGITDAGNPTDGGDAVVRISWGGYEHSN